MVSGGCCIRVLVWASLVARGWLAGWLCCPLLGAAMWMSECTWASVLHPLRSASYNGLDGEIRTMLATQARSGVREGYEMFMTLSTVSGSIYPT